MTRKADIWLSLLLVLLFCCGGAAAFADELEAGVVYERESDFVLFFGDGSTFSAASKIRTRLHETTDVYYEDLVLLADGSWYSLDRNAGDRLLELQSFAAGLTFRLDRPVPLLAEPSENERYLTGLTAAPGVYAVRRKAYDYVELVLTDGTIGWIRLGENLTDRVIEQPGRFVGAVKTLDDRLADGLTVSERIAPAATRSQTWLVPAFVTVHNTGNYEPYADAKWHAEQSFQLAEVPDVTYHFVVDEGMAYQMTPLDEVSFNAGDRYRFGNAASISIEITDQENSAHYAEAERNGARLAASILYQLGLAKDRLRFHVDWTGKMCPLNMIEGQAGSIGLDSFRALVGREYDRLVARHGVLAEGTEPARAGAVPTLLRRTTVTELDPAGRFVEIEREESIEIRSPETYGWLTYSFAGLFGAILLGAVVAAVGRGRKRPRR